MLFSGSTEDEQIDKILFVVAETSGRCHITFEWLNNSRKNVDLLVLVLLLLTFKSKIAAKAISVIVTLTDFVDYSRS